MSTDTPTPAAMTADIQELIAVAAGAREAYAAAHDRRALDAEARGDRLAALFMHRAAVRQHHRARAHRADAAWYRALSLAQFIAFEHDVELPDPRLSTYDDA